MFSLFLGILVYQAANLFDATNRWSLPLKFIADISIPFSLLLRLYLVILVIGGCKIQEILLFLIKVCLLI